jgi:hypothetical protein
MKTAHGHDQGFYAALLAVTTCWLGTRIRRAKIPKSI